MRFSSPLRPQNPTLVSHNSAAAYGAFFCLTCRNRIRLRFPSLLSTRPTPWSSTHFFLASMHQQGFGLMRFHLFILLIIIDQYRLPIFWFGRASTSREEMHIYLIRLASPSRPLFRATAKFLFKVRAPRRRPPVPPLSAPYSGTSPPLCTVSMFFPAS